MSNDMNEHPHAKILHAIANLEAIEAFCPGYDQWGAIPHTTALRWIMDCEPPECMRVSKNERIAKIAALAPNCDGSDELPRLQPVTNWMIVTPELLNAIDAGEHGNKFWLAAPGVEAAFAGTYAWRQGYNPHWFDTEGGVRWGASEITHVMPFTPPALPSAQFNPQARHI